MGSMLAEPSYLPSIVKQVCFGDTNGVEDVVLSAHTDTIQAMLITSGRHEDLGIMIKGRVADQDEKRILNDTLFQSFISARADRSDMLPDGVTSLLVDQSADGKPFECKFFRMNNLVEGVYKGQVNANMLMVNFGGVTEIEVGSDHCSEEDLISFTEELAWEVRTRQLGEIPVSMMKRRMQEPARLPSNLK